MTPDSSFVTYETEFVLFLGMLENSVKSMGRDSLHATLKVMKELKIFKSDITYVCVTMRRNRRTFVEGHYVINKRDTN